jgi:hypothetical protein
MSILLICPIGVKTHDPGVGSMSALLNVINRLDSFISKSFDATIFCVHERCGAER